ncbi:RseA family anti-sigma factor, partial [Escherichia coli]
MQKEKLSALMDGESFDSELLSSLSQDRTLQQSWQSYHLIRDTLRGDV